LDGSICRGILGSRRQPLHFRVSHFLPLANRKLSKTKIATNKIMHAITANEMVCIFAM
jgi:hypothetical protein